MRNVVDCYKDFFGYFNSLETHRGAQWLYPSRFHHWHPSCNKDYTLHLRTLHRTKQRSNVRSIIKSWFLWYIWFYWNSLKFQFAQKIITSKEKVMATRIFTLPPHPEMPSWQVFVWFYLRLKQDELLLEKKNKKMTLVPRFLDLFIVFPDLFFC